MFIRTYPCLQRNNTSARSKDVESVSGFIEEHIDQIVAVGEVCFIWNFLLQILFLVVIYLMWNMIRSLRHDGHHNYGCGVGLA